MTTETPPPALGLQEQLDISRKKVDVDQFDVPVRELLRMAGTNELRRAPVYQRKFRWTEDLESKLIESLFLGLPIPSIFVATNKDGRWELVDGLQRVSTLIHYVAEAPLRMSEIGKTDALRLSGLEELTSFNGTLFSELPEPIRLGFFKRGLRVTALSDKSDFEVRYDVFERLNRGSVVLSPQEVRACVFQGRFNDFIVELASTKAFLGLLKLEKTQADDGTKEEIVLKFFAYFYSRAQFRANVTKFLNKYMETATMSFPYDEARHLFDKTVSQLYGILAGPVLRRNTYVTPINQLEGILIGAADIIHAGGDIAPPAAGWLDDPVLVDASTGGTNTRKKFEQRIQRAKELLLGQAKTPGGRKKATRRAAKR